MQKEEIKEKSEKIFTFLYREGVSSSFRFPMGYGAAIMDKFADDILKREGGMVNIGILTDYCIHQAHLWRDVDRWRNFGISWVFGDKAIERFYASKRGVRFYQDLWLKDNGWSREELKSKFITFKVDPLKKFIYIEAEDSTKIKFLNTDAALAICINLTSGYSPESPVCQVCKFKDICADALKKSNPELYRLRIDNLKNK